MTDEERESFLEAIQYIQKVFKANIDLFEKQGKYIKDLNSRIKKLEDNQPLYIRNQN